MGLKYIKIQGEREFKYIKIQGEQGLKYKNIGSIGA